MANPVASFVAPPPNIAGSANQIGTVTFTDSAGNVVKVERVVINSPLGDVIASVDVSGGLEANLQTDSFAASESTIMRKLLENLLVEIQVLNANFVEANPGHQYSSAKDVTEVTQ